MEIIKIYIKKQNRKIDNDDDGGGTKPTTAPINSNKNNDYTSGTGKK